MKKRCIYFSLFFVMLVFCEKEWGQTLYWNTNGASNTWTAANWSATGLAPFTTAWTANTDAVFNANSTVTFATTSIGNVTVANGITITVTKAGTYSSNGAVRTFNVGTGSTLTWQSQVVTANSAAGITKSGAGILDLGALSFTTMTGGFTLNAGTVIVSGAKSFGSAAMTINGGTIQSSGSNTYIVTGITIGGDFTLTGTGNDIYGVATNLGASTRTITNSITSGTRTFSGVISGNAGVGLIFAGTGTSILSNANTYSGTTTITGGTLQYGINSALSTGGITVNGGIFDIQSYSDAIGTVTLTSGTITGTTGALTGTSYAIQSGTVSAILAGAVALTKTTAGTVTMSSANTYTGGTTITAGTIILEAANTLPSGGNVVLDGGTLQSGASTGYSQASSGTPLGTLGLTNSSTIALGTGSHALYFTNGGSFTSGKTLTITGWLGTYDGSSGTSGQIFIGNSAGLTAGQLAQIQFSYGGVNFPAAQRSSGEIVPKGSCTSAASPQMTGGIINSCQCTDEGDDEILFFNNSSCPINIDNSADAAANIQVWYGKVLDGSAGSWDNYTRSFVSDPSYVNLLNATALASNPSCLNPLFYDALTAGNTIPANSVFMIIRQTACHAYDFSALCGSGPIYVLFSSDGNWTRSGNFDNVDGTHAIRYFRTIITTSGVSKTVNYTYYPYLLTNQADGDCVSYPSGGGAPAHYFNNGCNIPTTILPIELLSFSAVCDKSDVLINWSTASETNNDYFTLERSKDDNIWETIAIVKGAGTSNNTLYYDAKDDASYLDVSYYRLKQTDFNGKYKYFDPVAVNCTDETAPDFNIVYIKTNESNNGLLITYATSVNGEEITAGLFSVLGQELIQQKQTSSIGNNTIELSNYNFSRGVYLLKLDNKEKVIIRKIIIP
jgi:autotransporter-associated beta strand protein